MESSTGGGSATNAGINYQQRLSALFLVSLLLDNELPVRIDGYVGLKLKEVAYETDSPIDDIQIRLEDESTIFFQAKRTINLSHRLESEFHKTIAQFIAQYISDLNSRHAYVLATSSSASDRITCELGKILQSIRLNDQRFTANPLTKSEQDTLQIYRAVVSKAYQDRTGRAISEAQFVEFSSKVFVLQVDIESDKPDERVALTWLACKCNARPELIWSQLIANSLSYASARLSVNRDGLLHTFGEFLQTKGPTIHLVDEEKFFSIVTMGESIHGKEILIFRTEVEEHDFVVAEFARFDKDCSKLLRFLPPDKCVFRDGATLTIIYRCAARYGVTRFIEENPEIFSGKTVAMFEREDSDALESTNCVQAHKELLQSLITQNSRSMRCVHCAKPISEQHSPVIELDDEESDHIVGFVHRECLRPIDRVRGVIANEFFDQYAFLKRFDVETWIKFLPTGQGGIRWNKQSLMSKFGIVHLAWVPEDDHRRDYSYCMKINLEGGAFEYATDRGRVERLNLAKARKTCDMMNLVFETARKQNDPWCVTSKRRTIGAYSGLLRLKDTDESCIECISVEVAQYNRLIGKTYDQCDNFYAPLCFLVDRDDEEPLMINRHLVILTDPLALHSYLSNWATAGIHIPDYEVRIISHDHEFDTKVSRFLERGFGVVIDPLVDKNKNLVAGMLVLDQRKMVSPEGLEFL